MITRTACRKRAVEVTDEAVEEHGTGPAQPPCKMVEAEEGAVIEKATLPLSTLQAPLTANRSAAAKAKAILWKLAPTPLSPALKTSL